LYDPKVNRVYAELPAHYDTLIDPARSVNRRRVRVERRCRMSMARFGAAESSSHADVKRQYRP